MDGGMSSNFQGQSWNLAWKLMSLLNKDKYVLRIYRD
ncbi:hypothetical protein Gogos_010530 [Gossypium gossypioides]|uniref:Uncharacterized protein n=1 Tax=Gossypium gossypioides TaxID=34282 RepID=A0A7J9BLH3_GOSGO|nr:hypothetical protein [Gossypium gossypioides]